MPVTSFILSPIETIEIPAAPDQRVFTEKRFVIGLFIGGPLMGGFMMSTNFKAIGEQSKVASAWAASFLTLAALIGVLLVIPASMFWPDKLLPVLYSFLGWLAYRKWQKPRVDLHQNAEGKTVLWWQVLLLALLWQCISLILLVVVVFADQGGIETDFASNTYQVNTASGYDIAFDTANVPEAEVMEMVGGLLATGFLAHADTNLFVEKTPYRWMICVPVDPGAHKSGSVALAYQKLRDKLDAYFPQYRFEVRLVEGDCDSPKVVFREIE